MTSEAQAPILPPAEADDKDAYPLSTVRADPRARKLIDIAAAHSDSSRAEFMLAASFEKAVQVVGLPTARRVLAEPREQAA